MQVFVFSSLFSSYKMVYDFGYYIYCQDFLST